MVIKGIEKNESSKDLKEKEDEITISSDSLKTS